VILLMHWGLEEYSYPSPSQRRIAKQLIEAGADLILGHHPHVLQGVEKMNRGLVAYSLGNFLFDNIEWSFVDQQGQKCNRTVEISKENRKGGALKVAFSENGVESYDLIPTFINSEGKVVLDENIERKSEFVRLCRGLNKRQYPLFWKGYSLRQEWSFRMKPLVHGKMTWSNLKKVRPKHFREFWEGLRRSGKITSEKSTNPYE
ncbi:MAG: CapA family protein, partial [Desulfobacterales bacterium]|nr:CapA family protein [Desulfobacterales bacterium]